MGAVEVQKERQTGAFVNEQACEERSPLSATEDAQLGLYRACALWGVAPL